MPQEGIGGPYREMPEIDRRQIILNLSQEFFNNNDTKFFPEFSQAINRGAKPIDITINIEGHTEFRFVKKIEIPPNLTIFEYENNTPLYKPEPKWLSDNKNYPRYWK